MDWLVHTFSQKLQAFEEGASFRISPIVERVNSLEFGNVEIITDVGSLFALVQVCNLFN